MAPELPSEPAVIARVAGTRTRVAEARAWLSERLTAEAEPGAHGEPELGESAGSEESEELGHALKQIFDERLISVRTMELNLRLAVAVGLLVLVAAAVLIGLRDVTSASLGGGTGATVDVLIPQIVFWVTIVLLALAWTYVLWGVLHAHRIVRIAGLVLFTWAMFELWHGILPLGVWRMAPSYALLVSVWLVGFATRRRRATERWQEELQLLALPLLLLLVGGLYVAFWWRLRPLHDSHIYTLTVYHQLGQLSIALIPLLYVAGVDFAEWGDAAATRAAEVLGSARRPYAIGAATCAVAAFAVGYRAATLDGRTFAVELGFGALFGVGVAVPALVAARSGAVPRVPYVALLLAALVLLALVVGGDKVLGFHPAGPPDGQATLRHAGSPPFQLDYPASWVERAVPGQNGLKLHVLGPPGTATRFLVVYIPRALAAAAPDPLGELLEPTVQSRGADGPWSLERFTAQGMPGVAWQRRDRGAIWLLVGLTNRAQAAGESSTFAAITHSWTTEVVAAPTAADLQASETAGTDRVLEVAALGWLGLAALGAFVVVRRRRRNPTWLSAAALFFVVTGVLYFLVELPHVAHQSGFPNVTAHLRLPGLQLATAIATLAVVGVLVARRRLAPPVPELLGLLLVLNGGLLAIQWIDRLIAGEEDAAGRFSIVQAVLIIVAFGWDILMSGEAITNRHTRNAPRHTRVLVYLGYVLLVTTAVLFFSSVRFLANGHVSEPGFESDAYPDSGLLIFGSAFLITLFVARAGRLWQRPRKATEGEPEPEPS